MEALIPLVISLIESSLPLIAGKSPLIAKTVGILTAVAPRIYSTYRELMPVVKRQIATLKADPATTDELIVELEAAEVILDAEFDETAAAALAEDAAAAAKPA